MPAHGAVPATIGSMPNIGPLEIVIVLIIVLIIFGPKRLPEMGRSLGRGLREFKSSLTRDDDRDERPELPGGPSERSPEGEAVREHKV